MFLETVAVAVGVLGNVGGTVATIVVISKIKWVRNIFVHVLSDLFDKIAMPHIEKIHKNEQRLNNQDELNIEVEAWRRRTDDQISNLEKRIDLKRQMILNSDKRETESLELIKESLKSIKEDLSAMKGGERNDRKK